MYSVHIINSQHYTTTCTEQVQLYNEHLPTVLHIYSVQMMLSVCNYNINESRNYETKLNAVHYYYYCDGL